MWSQIIKKEESIVVVQQKQNLKTNQRIRCRNKFKKYMLGYVYSTNMYWGSIDIVIGFWDKAVNNKNVPSYHGNYNFIRGTRQ